MKIIDRIYGEDEIREPVLIDLINSPEVQRLKLITMSGPPQEYWYEKVFSRYEHSIGVLILLRKLNASLEEQIAGLLHDVSHTAFSHVIDWVLGDPEKEDYQDTIHSNFLQNSSLKEILEKYGFDSKKISNLKNFTLLEKEIPAICADRFDYAIREIEEKIGLSQAQKMFLDLVNVKNQIAFSSTQMAIEFRDRYAERQKNHWGAEESKKRFFVFAKIFKIAINKKILFLDDFLKTSQDVLNKLVISGDEEILNNLILLKKKNFLEEFKDTKFELKKKERFVDPEVFFMGNLLPLSKIADSKIKNEHP